MLFASLPAFHSWGASSNKAVLEINSALVTPDGTRTAAAVLQVTLVALGFADQSAEPGGAGSWESICLSVPV